MYDEILMPTDGSEGAEAALDHAFELAEKFDARIHAVYVIDIRIDRTSELLEQLEGKYEDIGEKATDKIVQKAHRKDLAAVKSVKRGIPHKELNAYADEHGIDLVVMGTHGRTGLERFMMGSTTEKVIRTSEVPVMTVNRD